MQEYKILQAATTVDLERMVVSALNDQGMTLYGPPSEFGGRKVQTVIKGIEGGSEPGTPGVATVFGGHFYYANSEAPARLSSGVWTQMKNNAQGASTDLRFAPDGVSAMLDPGTGKIVLFGLKVGDQVYMQHVVNFTPMVNGVKVSFRNVSGSGADLRVSPFGPRLTLDSGAGAPSGDVSCDSFFYIRSQADIDSGISAEVQASGACDIDYKSLYISVSRSKQ